MSNTLHLTLKGEFFDMIAQGIKKEEYREIKPFWIKRFLDEIFKNHSTEDFMDWYKNRPKNVTLFHVLNSFDNIKFYKGWACSTKYKNMTVEFKGIDIGEPNTEWSGGMTGVMFRINLGEILEIKEGTLNNK